MDPEAFVAHWNRVAGWRGSVLRVPTPIVEEDGRVVALIVLLYEPAGTAPFPTLVFHHGSTDGLEADPALLARPWAMPGVVRFFTERGWAVAFPQRRGRGGSGGRYDEGLAADGSGYSFEPAVALAGLERALQDADLVADALARHPAIAPDRLLAGGHSRGGLLSIVHAGTRPGLFRGALNFVGGWVGDHGPSTRPEAINTVAFRRAAACPLPTLWLYATRDAYYATDHPRMNFDAFIAAGGEGSFRMLDLGPGVDGHHLVAFRHAWSEAVDDFLRRL